MKHLLVLILGFVAATPAWAGPPVSLVDPNNNATGTTANPLVVTSPPGQGQSVSDPNNAPYSSAGAPFATGTTVAAGRAIYLNCPAAGTVTMTLSVGGSIAYPVTAGASVLPFSVVQVSADTASCTHQTIN